MTYYDEFVEELATSDRRGEYIGFTWLISFDDKTKPIKKPEREYDEIMEAYEKECKEADKGDHVSKAITLYKVHQYSGGVEEEEFICSNC